MKIAIIGAGNVATHMAVALSGSNDIVQIVARTEASAIRLADRLNARLESTGLSTLAICGATAELSSLQSDCDLYIIAVNDDKIAEVVAATRDFPGVWVHTSGSVSVDVFKGKKTRYGVFYPLQTFSRDVATDFKQVPMMVEGSSAEVATMLYSLAQSIAGSVKQVDSKTREAIHVAAVFACNFANLMWLDADRLLREEGLDISYMLPLLQATLDKLREKTPEDAMTGPARRNDMNVINKHIEQLPVDLKPVYQLLTENILNLYHPKS
jgi:predicted short-subunit dehydrogenase-like oxidoreductase (DUF2520 family)